jgi:non-reducing end alpha-L-arabinofuranosidase
MLIRRMLLAIATSVSALALAGALAQAANATTYSEIDAAGTGGLCLDDPGWNSSNGVQLDVWECNGGSNQKFGFVPSSAGFETYLITLADNHSKCLADPYDSWANGVRLEVWTCSDTAPFQWWIGESLLYGEFVSIHNLDNGHVFGNNSALQVNGNPVVMWQYYGGAAQSWMLFPRP